MVFWLKNQFMTMKCLDMVTKILVVQRPPSCWGSDFPDDDIPIAVAIWAADLGYRRKDTTQRGEGAEIIRQCLGF